MKRLIFEIVSFLLSLILISTCLFTVDEKEIAVVLQFGKPVTEITEAGGPHFKLPWPFQDVHKLDKRWQMYDSDPREIITKDKKTLLTDSFGLFRITNGIEYLKNTQTMANAQTRMDEVIYSEMRNRLGRNNFEQIVVTDRQLIMDSITQRSDMLVKDKKFGLEIAIVRMNRVDLPEENKKSVFGRMMEERSRKAKKYRAEGYQDSLTITSETDRMAKEIMASAEKESRQIRGQAEAKATAIYNAAYGSDPEFFRLLRSLEILEEAYAEDSENLNWVFNGDELHLRALFGKK
ncbi:MAG: protease modulator HflC [Candidatus Kerfeldbacteria bacterium]